MKNSGALIVNAILAANASLIVEKRKSISFALDHEGKRLINLEVNKLYNKYFKPDYDSLVCIVITTHVVMEKMSTLKRNSWSMYELRDQVESALTQGNDRTKNKLVELSQTPVMKIVQETPAIKGSFHEKFPATMKTLDGHFVRSKSEILIDNFLYNNGIVHAYERKLPIEDNLYCDFYIPQGSDRPYSVYIEFWGLETETYLKRKESKLQIYKKEKLNLIELTDKDVLNIDDILPQKLLQYKIKIK